MTDFLIVRAPLESSHADYFGIESDTGKLYVKKNLESRTEYSIVVTATDDGVPENRTLGVQVTVYVKEVNNYPPVFSHSSYKGTVLEKYATDRVIIKVSASLRFGLRSSMKRWGVSPEVNRRPHCSRPFSKDLANPDLVKREFRRKQTK